MPARSLRRPSHRPGLRPRNRRVAVALLAAATLTLTGCGARLASPPPPLPTADADETARQEAASRSTALAAQADAALATLPADPGDGAVAAALRGVADDSRAHAEELGGVWAPPGWASATTTAVATPSTTSAADGPAVPGADASAPSTHETSSAAEPATVLENLGDASARTCQDATVVDRADLARLLASVCLAQDELARVLAGAAGLDPPAPGTQESAGGTGEHRTELLAVLAQDTDALSLARSLDAAGYALEVAAARAAGPERDTLAARARTARADAQALLVARDAVASPTDPRRAAYDLPDVDGALPDAGTLAATTEADVLAAWTAAFGDAPPTARPGVLAEMVEAAAQAAAWGAPASDFPGLPGLTP